MTMVGRADPRVGVGHSISADEMVRQIVAGQPDTRASSQSETPAIGRMAAVSLSRCAEQTAKDIEATIERVRALADEIETEGGKLLNDIRERSIAFEQRIEGFSRLTESVALTMRQSANDVATFGGGDR